MNLATPFFMTGWRFLEGSFMPLRLLGELPRYLGIWAGVRICRIIRLMSCNTIAGVICLLMI